VVLSAVNLATIAGDTRYVYSFALSGREENERNNNSRRKRYFSAA